MWLVLFLPWLSNWLRRPVGVYPPGTTPTQACSWEVGVTFLPWAGHADQYWSLWFPILLGPAARLRVSCPFQCQGLTDHRDGSWVPRPPADSCFTKQWIWRWEWQGGGCTFWLSRKGTLRKHCQVISAHPLPARGKWGAALSFRGVWWHVWAPA